MPGSETPGTDATLRERRPQPDGHAASASPDDAAARVRELNDEAKEKKTYGRTLDGTSQLCPQ